jgi:hypothetical protein
LGPRKIGLNGPVSELIAFRNILGSVGGSF